MTYVIVFALGCLTPPLAIFLLSLAVVMTSTDDEIERMQAMRR